MSHQPKQSNHPKQIDQPKQSDQPKHGEKDRVYKQFYSRLIHQRWCEGGGVRRRGQ